jgi:penicillin-binding protein 2
LWEVVASPAGTGHKSVYWPRVPIAGKTGTAESGGGRPDHAWFAGYAPANRPRVAFVVVLEHAGTGGTAAGPVARGLVEALDELQLLGRETGSQESPAASAN